MALLRYTCSLAMIPYAGGRGLPGQCSGESLWTSIHTQTDTQSWQW